MSDVEELEARIIKLPSEDRARLRDWFLEMEDRAWDEQIAADRTAGKLQGLIERAREEFAAGKAREL